MNENTLSTDHLIGIKPLKLEDIELILHTAGEFKEVLQRPIKKVPSLRDITIANMFLKIQQGLNCLLNWQKSVYQQTSLIFLPQVLPLVKVKLCWTLFRISLL